MAQEVEREKLEQLQLKSKTIALETYHGEYISAEDIEKKSLEQLNKNLILKKDITLKDGKIIYPSELEYAVIKKIKPNQRAPHNPN